MLVLHQKDSLCIFTYTCMGYMYVHVTIDINFKPSFHVFLLNC